MTDKPIVLMPEDVQRMMGKDAQRNNIFAAKIIAEIVKTTLGPKGMDKMLVTPTGEIIITNDGVTILEEMQIEHPAAKMMIEIAKTQEKEVGDGTTTAVMIAGKLLENAEHLLDKKVHPTIIAKGYRLAAEKSKEFLKELAIKIDSTNENILQQIAMTSMTGKGAEDMKEHFAKIIVKAVKQIQDQNKIDLDNIKIEKISGGGIKDTELINGLVIDNMKTSIEMPQIVQGARIALVDFPLEVKQLSFDTKISINSPEQWQNFIQQEENMIRTMIEKIKNTGANVVLCQKGIDDLAQYFLAKNKIYACRRVAKSDLEKIAKATGAKIITNYAELNMMELGNAEVVEEIKQGDDTLTYIRGCQNPKAVTLLIHGGTSHVTDEIERAIKDGLGDVAAVLKTGMIVAGGGAIEMELAKRLRNYGQSLSGREQLAVEEFANALEFIPVTLAENAGLDPIEFLTELKYKHENGEKHAGLNLFTNKVENTLEQGIVEPMKIKTQAIDSATEVSTMILRIDDVIAANNHSSKTNSNPYQGMD